MYRSVVNGSVPEQKPDLFEFATAIVTEPSTCTSKIVGRRLLMRKYWRRTKTVSFGEKRSSQLVARKSYVRENARMLALSVCSALA